jgi:hypothetical protein
VLQGIGVLSSDEAMTLRQTGWKALSLEAIQRAKQAGYCPALKRVGESSHTSGGDAAVAAAKRPASSPYEARQRANLECMQARLAALAEELEAREHKLAHATGTRNIPGTALARGPPKSRCGARGPASHT